MTSQPSRAHKFPSRFSALAGVGILALATLTALPGCEKPREKAQRIYNEGSLIGVTLTEGDKIVGKPVTKHDEYNYYWDMGPGNGVIQVLVRGGKITRVDFEDSFQPRTARDNTMPPEKPAPEGTGPTIELPDSPPIQGDG